MSHMKSCPKIPLDCPACSKSFYVGDDMINHLRTDCYYVEIQCNTCNEQFLRSKFNYHKCVKDIQEWKDLVCDYDGQLTKLEAENADLKGRLGDV